MDLDFPDADDIESVCYRRLHPEPVQDPEPVLPRCKAETVTWFDTERGTRLYVCRDHALEPLRFHSNDLPEDPDALLDHAREQGVNPEGLDYDELVDRLRHAVDASDVDDHPRVSPCRSCHKLTLVDDLDWTERKCPSCRGEAEEIDPERVVEATV